MDVKSFPHNKSPIKGEFYPVSALVMLSTNMMSYVNKFYSAFSITDILKKLPKIYIMPDLLLLLFI